MINRVQQTAIEVLREHQEGIKIDYADQSSDGYMIIRIVKQDSEALDEIKSALSAIQAVGINLKIFMKSKENTIGIKGEKYWDHDPQFAKEYGCEINQFPNSIHKLATFLADAGVNFPGSEIHRTKTVSS